MLRASRVDVTTQLVSAIEAAHPRPRVLVSSSAVGVYGDRRDERLDESASPGDDFLARLCQDWEAAARRAATLGLRVVTLRTGVVLGRGGGALARMLPPFKAGVGGPIGSGRQYLAWIHLHDLVNLIATALGDDRYAGPVNAVAPDSVTSARFARALGRALHRPAVLPTPAAALRAIFGDSAVVLLASQRVDPGVARRNAFVWQFGTIDAALLDVVGGASVRIVRAPSSAGAGGGMYLLTGSTAVAAPLDDVFAFFSNAGNLGVITPASLKFRVAGPVPPLAEGAAIEYAIRVGPLPIRWRTRIVRWEAPRAFVDVQEIGPYRVWRHEHVFAADDGRTRVDDRVDYTPPFGPLAGLVNRLFVAPTLREIFRHRADVMRLRFG